MNSFKRMFRGFSEVWAWLILVAALATTAVVLTPKVAMADKPPDEGKLSFYKSASAAAVYFDGHLDKMDIADDDSEGDGTAGDNSWKDGNVPFYKAGGLLGFPDPDYDTVLGGFFAQLTSAEVSFSYDTFVPSSTEGNEHFTGFAEYCMYGNALRQLGVDETRPAGIGIDFSMVGRWLCGVPMIIGYSLSAGASFVFYGILTIMNWFNPFAWLYNGVEALSNADNSFFDNGPMHDIVGFIASIYEGILGIRWVVIVLSLVFLIVGILLFRKNPASSFKQYFGKLAFLILAIPIMGTLYTNILTDLTSLFEDNENSWLNPTTIVSSTIVDFRDWAKERNLALPQGVIIYTDSDGKVDFTNSTTPRDISVAVHAMLGQNTGADTDTYTYSSSNLGESIMEGYELIGTMMSGVTYNEASYETDYKAKIERYRGNGTGNILYETKTLYDDLEKTQNSDTFRNEDKGVVSGDIIATQPQYVYFRDGGNNLRAEANFNTYGGNNYQEGNKGFIYTSNGYNNNMGGDPEKTAGLSPMSMYNYLASEFKDDSVSVYSSHKLTSGISRTAHAAANIVGESPWQKALNAGICSTQMIAIGFIGIGYGIGMLIESIKKAVKLVTNMPIAMVGFIPKMVQVIEIFISLVAEVIVTVAIYELLTSFIFAIGSMFSWDFWADIWGKLNSLDANSAKTVYDFSTESFIGSTVNWAEVLKSVFCFIPIALNIAILYVAVIYRSRVFAFVGKVGDKVFAAI